MAWEERGNNLYYYRKKRVGGRVVSQYIGAGEVAREIARVDELKREKRELLRKEERDRITQHKELDNDLARCADTLQSTAFVILSAQRYHRHKGQWRRRRRNESRPE